MWVYRSIVRSSPSRHAIARTVQWTRHLCDAQKLSQTQPNIILMGSPGCGKTTVGRILGERLQLPVLDVDDHHLEPYWGVSVAQKLSEVGSEGFVAAEGEALKAFCPQGSVISLTGSNPMHAEAMEHISKTGRVYFMDVHKSDILERLERMKVSRIVGQNDGTSMAEILDFRQQFYERWYDERIICERLESPENVADKVLACIAKLQNPKAKGYESTRGFNLECSTFNDALLQGLAPDGGLVVPRAAVPFFTLGQLDRLIELSYPERVLRVLERWIPCNEICPSRLSEMIHAAYGGAVFQDAAVCPVRPLTGSDGQFIQELFHGPTASFKDFALQLMPRMFLNAASECTEKHKYLILVATSGDTGGAVLDGFTRVTEKAGSHSPGVLVLYPRDGISSIQRDQMVFYHGNRARVIGVEGADFDACQTMVKKIFQNVDINKTLLDKYQVKLSAANSISWGRLLPQVAYHVSSYLDLVKKKVIAMGNQIDLCIPTGNFGNILAAYYAKEMGVPIKRLVCASNSNNVLTDFLSSGCYDITKRRLQQTVSPAIDILVSSNLERLLHHVTNRECAMVREVFEQLRDNKVFSVPKQVAESLHGMFSAGWATDEDCKAAIKTTREKSNYLLDTHTGIAKSVADRFQGDRPMVIVATAHPAKFAHDILASFGRQINHRTPVDLIRGIADEAALPGLHEALLKTLSSADDKPKLTCENNIGHVLKQVTDLARCL
ncbi:threonine synthase-like 1 [Dreissena polymorpha]|uniref:Threonine synthase N-terminal domain-containing protein n=1 Tax=Dreissena polymorpha TaxID=45954 RepID=A0A9D4GSK3_DREPO|nr:threonine synthase-like 1 [Dreissena polymorpha]KAH3820725.1 hypothetical protein DPMN_122474 [Dreissena polymorpha]